MTEKESALSSVLRVETDHEREVTHQLKQAKDTVDRLTDELRKAADKQRELQEQLVDANNDITRLLLEKETNVRHCKIYVLVVLVRQRQP